MHVMNETALAIDSELTFLEKEDVWGPKLLQVVTRAHMRSSPFVSEQNGSDRTAYAFQIMP